jgi:hypothetical protein
MTAADTTCENQETRLVFLERSDDLCAGVTQFISSFAGAAAILKLGQHAGELGMLMRAERKKTSR